MKKHKIPEQYHEPLGRAKQVLTFISLAVILITVFVVSDKVMGHLFYSMFIRRIIYSIFFFIIISSSLMYLAIVLDLKDDEATNWFNYRLTDIFHLIKETVRSLIGYFWNPNTMAVPCLLFIGTFYITSFAADFIIFHGMWGLDSLYNLCPTFACSILCFVLMLGIILFAFVVMIVAAVLVFIKSLNFFEKKKQPE